VRESRLDESVVATLTDKMRAAGGRLLLIRRIFRDPAAARRWAVADARAGQERVWWGEFTDERELAELDLTDPPGIPTEEPVFLVCTHGRRDPCCVRRGWPVALALGGVYPRLTWQCSHVGGDRFAANVVALPHGLYYGRVTPPASLELGALHHEGRVTLDYFRGRTIFPPPVQAAQHYARLQFHETRIDALAPAEPTALDAATSRVRLARAEGDVVVTVRRRYTAPMPGLTCNSVTPGVVSTYDLVTLELEAG